MAAIVINPLPAAGNGVRLWAALRGFIARRLWPRLRGVEMAYIQGRAIPLQARPLGVARELIPAILRCSEALLAGRIDDAFYSDLVQALALGLNLPPRVIESFAVSLWDLAKLLDVIARVNGLQAAEGSADLGKFQAVLNGTNSIPPSSPPPAGAGSTSTNA